MIRPVSFRQFVITIVAIPFSCVVVWGQSLAEDPNHRQLVTRYCVGCHNDRTLTAGVSLQNLDLAEVGHDEKETEVWEKVIRKLRTRSMP